MSGHRFRLNDDHDAGPVAELSLDPFALHPFSPLGGVALAVRMSGRPGPLAKVIGSLHAAISACHGAGGASDGPPADDGAPGFHDWRHRPTRLANG